MLATRRSFLRECGRANSCHFFLGWRLVPGTFLIPFIRRVLIQTTAIPQVAALVCLSYEHHALAVATYDYLSDVTITCNVAWDAYTPTDTSTTSGSGQHNESTAPSRNSDPQNLQFYQIARISGSAGDSPLGEGGISHAFNRVETTLAFDFGSTPTNLTITLDDYNQVISSSRQLPQWDPTSDTGEYIGYWPTLGGGGTALGLAFDGEWIAIPDWVRGESVTFARSNRTAYSARDDQRR